MTFEFNMLTRVSCHNEDGCLFNDHCGGCGTIYGIGDFQIVCFDDGNWQYVRRTSGLKEVKGFGGEVYPAE